MIETYYRSLLGYLRQSLENGRKMFGDFRLAFGTIIENLQQSSESDRKSLGICQNRRC